MIRCDCYREYWEEQYARAYASGKRFWRAGRALTPELRSLLSRGVLKQAPARVFEVGCGDGLNSMHLARRGYDVTGMDVSSEAIARAQRLAPHAQRLRFVCGDVTDPATALNEPYDLWIDVKTLHCLWEDAQHCAYFDALRRALRPGGCAYVNVGLALADVRRYFPAFFARLPDDVRRDADALARDLPPEQRAGIRCETLDYLCDAFHAIGFEILRAGCAVGDKQGWGAIIIAHKPAVPDKRRLAWKPMLEGVADDFHQLTPGCDPSVGYWNICELNVQACESRVYEVVRAASADRLSVLPDPVIFRGSRSDDASTNKSRGM